jgi:hypothetical protein
MRGGVVVGEADDLACGAIDAEVVGSHHAWRAHLGDAHARVGLLRLTAGEPVVRWPIVVADNHDHFIGTPVLGVERREAAR